MLPYVNSLPPGQLIREARRRAGMSEVELGRRAGVTQSVVSAYESGARQPSMPVLERLVRAAGSELDVSLRDVETSASKRSGPLARRVFQHREKIRDVVARHGLSNPRVFGSVARGEDAVDSDLD
ncbi:MAG: helix-turn-helix domain-containing protein, partial [Chloroflexi bacterium]